MVLVDAVAVAPGGVALPELDQRVGDGVPVVIEHAATDGDARAERLARVLARKIVVRFADVVMAENRPSDFRKRMREDDQRLPWRSRKRETIWRIQIRP